jgi:hypothetical protein
MILKIFKNIFRGRKLYRDFISRNKPEPEDFIVIFPHQTKEAHYQGLLYLDSFRAYLQFLANLTEEVQIYSLPIRSRFFIISPEQTVVESAAFFSRHIAHTELWNAQDINAFINYYAVFMPPCTIFASLDEPNGRSCSHLIGVKGIDLKTMVCMGIYGMMRIFASGLQTPKQPCYNGNNQCIKDFMYGVSGNI